MAQKIISANVPEILLAKRVLTLDLASIVAGTKYRGEFEERLKNIMKEIRKANNVILFIDELHTLIGAGGAEGAIDAANMLKPALSRGELQCIGATTLNEYKKYIEKDSALERRFQPIIVEEPTIFETIQILKGLKKGYEQHHRVEYSDECLDAAANLASRYISDRFLPDKAVDLVDEVGAKARLKKSTRPQEFMEIESEISKLLVIKDDYVKAQDYEKAAEMRDKVNELKRKLKTMTKRWKEEVNSEVTLITSDDISNLVSSMTGIPVDRINESESQKLLKMENELHKKVIGQNEAIEAISRAVRRSRTGLKSPKRPTGSFIFLGPTGVGKTYLAKTLAEFLFGDEDALLRVDMSEFMEKHSVARLVGAPPGYVGYGEGGELTEKVRRRPYSVILLDEIEKAHPDVFNILLQVLEEGQLSDNLGHTVDFRNTVVIMTSNIGTQRITSTSAMGFMASADEERDFNFIKDKATDELKKSFNPEFLNRIDAVVVFHPLLKDNVREIVGIMLEELRERLKLQKLEFEITQAAKDFIIEKGFDKKYGARPLRRTIQREIEDSLSEYILRGVFKPNDKVFIDSNENEAGEELTFTKVTNEGEDSDENNNNKEEFVELHN